MVRLLLGLLLSLIAVTTAHAVCPATLELQDANGVKAPALYTDDGSGNCQVNTATKDGSNSTLGAKADGVWSSGSGSLVAIGKAIATNTGAAVPTGTNAIGAVNIRGNSGNNLDGTAGSPSLGVVTVQGANSMTPLLVTPNAAADPCMSSAKTNFALASTATNTQAVAGVSAKKVYLCSIAIISAGAVAINIIEGTGSTCVTANQAAVFGSTTASSGMSVTTNGGFTVGSGNGTVGVTATAANGICVTQNGTAALAGNVTYVQQ